MTKDNEKVTANIVSNDAVRGKPYLDIDRVFYDGITGTTVQMGKESIHSEES